MVPHFFINEESVFAPQENKKLKSLLSGKMFGSERAHTIPELSVSFEYQIEAEDANGVFIQRNDFLRRSSSYSLVSAAAMNANPSLPNTNIANGLYGEDILPTIDSPNSFRRVSSVSSFSRLDPLSSSQGSMSALARSTSSDGDYLGAGSSRGGTAALHALGSGDFLNQPNGMNIQMAGGAAGEDRVQAVCSEENGWLFCGIYDGFSGRDAADFLAGTLYGQITEHLYQVCDPSTQRNDILSEDVDFDSDGVEGSDKTGAVPFYSAGDSSMNSFQQDVMDCIKLAVSQADNEFLTMVEREAEERLDLACVGSCVLVSLLLGNVLYTLNIGDSRAVLATIDRAAAGGGQLKAVELTEIHTVDNPEERRQLLADHPDDPFTIYRGKVKGKLNLTRALGAGYLKKKGINDMLTVLKRVQAQNLSSPPYIHSHPFTSIHSLSEEDLFVVLGSDGLFDFFSNDEIVDLVHSYIQENQCGEPAKYLVELLVQRAAEKHSMTAEQLMGISVGPRRKFHDDVTVIVIILGNKHKLSSAAT